MSQRPGLYARVETPAPKPKWNHPDLPDPRSQVPFVNVEIRVHWPDWAERSTIRLALDEAYANALSQLTKRTPRG